MSSTVILELGDIIEIKSPEQGQYHEKVFLIDYIDEKQLDIIDIAEGNRFELSIENGVFQDEFIHEIHLLDRNEKQGFIAQNDLQTNSWINIHFGGDYPTTITGRISNIENDMLEVTVYPDIQVIYIDFKYQGIPKEIPIERIEVREPPAEIRQEYSKEIQKQENIPEGDVIDPEMDVSPQEATLEEEDKLEEELEDLYNETNEIIFGDKLESIKEIVEVSEKERRYDIEIQLNDLMDELLSTIPVEKRTPELFDNVKLLLGRFKELRNNYSIFENDFIILKPKEKGPFYKPLIHHLKEFTHKLKWLVPVVQLRKKLCHSAGDIDTYGENMRDIVGRLNQNTSSYVERSELVAEAFRPFIPPYENSEALHIQEINNNIEGIIDNLTDFNSTVIKHDNNGIQKFVISQYNLSTNPNIGNDKIYVRSFVTLPQQMMALSKVFLNDSNLLERVSQTSRFRGMYQLLNDRTDVIENVIENLDNELDIKDMDLLSEISHFSVSPDINMEKKAKYERFLESFVPKTKSVIKLLRNQMKKKYDYVSCVRELEPFLIYPEDITYSHYNDIRYALKENIQNYKKELLENAAVFRNTFKEQLYKNDIVSEIMKIFNNASNANTNANTNANGDDEINDFKTIQSAYGLSNIPYDSEMLQKMLSIDNGKMLYTILAKKLFHLHVPTKMDDILDEKPNKLKNTCDRRFLAKDYASVEELTKDNNAKELFYDEKYDDTPYHILDEYSNEKRNMSNDNFIDFITEVLIQKHEAHASYAENMAKTIVRGKKVIEEGDFALLDDGENVHYYKYTKNNWIRDKSVNEEMFMSDNELFCNIQSKCVKNKTNNACETIDIMTDRINIARTELLKKELNNRITLDLNTLEDTLKENIRNYQEYLKRYSILKDVLEHKHNNIAYQLGLYATASTSLKSPHFDLLQKILGNRDFSEKQHQIVKFVKIYCREPIENAEQSYWKYCKDSNVKLLPSFIHTLAETFVMNLDYQTTLMRVVREQGLLSDDGEAIIDKHSGMVIRKIDYSTDEGFDPMGFAISSRDIMEEDLMVLKERHRQKEKVIRTFENPSMEKIYNVFVFLCDAMDIKQEQIENFVFKVSNDLVHTQIIGEAEYNKRAAKLQKEKGKTLKAYAEYYNETLVLIVTSTLFVSVQTVIPEILTRKTFPGCVNSFDGYPMNGEEDISGIEYVSCVLYKTRSNTEPWNGVYKLSQANLTKRIKVIVESSLMNRTDVSERYKTKRQYIQIHGERKNRNIHNVKNWLHFEPPLIKYEMEDPINFSKDFKTSLLDYMKAGNKKQGEMYQIVRGKMSLYNFALVNAINKIVRQQTPLLKTYGMIPFVDNACCNSGETPMDYFQNKNDQLSFFLKNISQNEDFIRDIRKLSKATILYHNSNTRVLYPALPKGQLEENVYAAFIHYGNYDRNMPVPSALEGLISEKPSVYDSDLNIDEKMVILKQNGKKYDMHNLLELMKIINTQNQMQLQYSSPHNILEDILVFFEELEVRESNVIEEPLIRLFKRNMKNYKDFHYYTEDTVELEQLKNYLLMTNNKIYQSIMDFIDRYGSPSNQNYDRMNEYLLQLSSWVDTSSHRHHTLSSFLRTNIHNMASIYPSIIKGQSTHGKSPLNTELAPRGNASNFSENHLKDLTDILSNQYGMLNTYLGNEFLVKLFDYISPAYDDLIRFTNLLPLRNEKDRFTLFDYRTQELLLSYVYLSLFFELIQGVSEREMEDLQIELRKTNIRKKNDETKDEDGISSEHLEMNEEDIEEQERLQEVEVQMGNVELSNNKVAQFIMSVLDVHISHKKDINHNYETITKKTKHAKDYERKQIIKYLGNMTIEQRKVEELHKQFKLERWNVTDIHRYQPDVYDKEKEEMARQLADNSVEGGDVIREMNDDLFGTSTRIEANNIEDYENDENEEFYEREAYDISNLGEDYQDGNYYEEDQEFYD